MPTTYERAPKAIEMKTDIARKAREAIANG